MKKLAIAVTGALALAGIGAGVSSAINPDITIKPSVSPSKHGTKKKPRKAKLVVKLSTTPNPNEAASPVTLSVVHLPSELVFHGKALKSCTATMVAQNNTACPKGSKVGSGLAKGNVRNVAGEDLTVTAYNGPGGKKLELLLDSGNGAVQIHQVIEGVLSSDKAPYGNKLTVPIPQSLQEIAGAKIELLEFDTTINAVTGAHKKPYVGIAKCKDKKVSFGVDYTYQDGTHKSITTTAACS